MMKTYRIFIALFVLAIIFTCYIQATKKEVPLRVFFFSLEILPNSTDHAQPTINAINSLLSDNPDVARQVIFIDTAASFQHPATETESINVGKVLSSIQSNPILVFGERFSTDKQLSSLIATRYEHVLLHVKNVPLLRIVKTDTTGLISDALLKLQGVSLNSQDMEMHKDPQVQYNWLSTLTGQRAAGTVLVANKYANRVDNEFQNKFMEIMCESPISLYVYPSGRQPLYHNGACVGNSYRMLGAKTHTVGFIGVQTANKNPQSVSYTELILSRGAAKVIHHETSL